MQCIAAQARVQLLCCLSNAAVLHLADGCKGMSPLLVDKASRITRRCRAGGSSTVAREVKSRWYLRDVDAVHEVEELGC